MPENKYERFLREENETKPNHYSAATMLLVGGIMIVLWAINAVGLFRVDKTLMTECTIMELMVVAVIQFFGRHPKWKSNPVSKFIIISCVLLVAFIAYTCLNFHVSLSVMFPLLLAGQYHNKKISMVSFIGSIFISFAAPVCGNLLHTWDQLYLEVMLEISGIKILSTAASDLPVYAAKNIIQILFYMGLPIATIVCGFSPIMFAVARTGMDNINNRVSVMRLSESDQLTGALNRNCFETMLDAYPRMCRESLTCLYGDVNGLHEMNNEFGHAAGDEMLKYIASVLKDAFGNEDTYRIGGDEFVCLVKDMGREEFEAKVSKIQRLLSEKGYNMSLGISTHNFDDNIQSLIQTAEKQMYKNKREYYMATGNTRIDTRR